MSGEKLTFQMAATEIDQLIEDAHVFAFDDCEVRALDAAAFVLDNYPGVLEAFAALLSIHGHPEDAVVMHIQSVFDKAKGN